MTDATTPEGRRRVSVQGVDLGLARRYAKERRLKWLGIAAIAVALGLLALLIADVVLKGYTAFWTTEVRLTVDLAEAELDPDGTRLRADLEDANFRGLVNDALYAMFPAVEDRLERRRLRGLVSGQAARDVQRMVLNDPSLIGTTRDVWVLADTDIDQLWKGNIDRDLPENRRRVNDQVVGWVDQLAAEDRIRSAFAWNLFTNADSRDPQLAGVWGAIVGSFWIIVVTTALAVPIGVASAVYLEEFAPKTRWTDLIEVNINNLAAVPSIVFGLLGLAVFINTMGLPRSAPIVGGLTITLMTLPTVVVATRAALRAVPPSIRWGALGVGASRVQVVSHHVLPLALPGILTGTIIGLAQALGETAPLLMIGMIAFVVDIPDGPMSASTALPVQVYLWASSPERGFTEKTAAAILILLGFLIVMNALAIYLRRRFERNW
ncbi:MAG: phosphate ABC transporter permease PstA [Alphaproteobacteria bacterium]|jgi:phosphate transport system permease protein|nr:phosphate ABC transporter permease PstA [Alphaproteobacteria bacterium]